MFLSNEAIAAPHLAAWLDQLEAGENPVLLCIGPSDLAVPRTGHAMTQRRIDLLAIEQNAWVLAARDPRCVVVETRTELDWAMRQGQVSVWAPSKIVLDAVDGPSAKGGDAVVLALWFARAMQAASFMAIGESLPETPADLPGRSLPVTATRL